MILAALMPTHFKTDMPVHHSGSLLVEIVTNKTLGIPCSVGLSLQNVALWIRMILSASSFEDGDPIVLPTRRMSVGRRLLLLKTRHMSVGCSLSSGVHHVDLHDVGD